MSPFQASNLAILGKAPSHVEFLRLHAGEPPLVAFDTWLAESFEWALGHGGPAFSDAFSHARVHAFALRAPGERGVVCGVLGPSADSAGRRFPLAIAAAARVAEDVEARPDLLPLIFENVWSAADGLFGLVQSGALGELTGARGGSEVAPDLALDEAAALYARWAAELPLGELWQLIGVDRADAGAWLRALSLAVEPLRGKEPPETRLALRLPLGRAGGVAACFWIDVVRRLLGWRHTLPSFFWSHDGDGGAVFLLLDRPPRAVLAELFVPTGASDEVCDFTRGFASALNGAPPLPAPLVHVLESSDSSVETLLASLHAD
jgi:type VI secretion system ImpM family protein